MLGEAPPPQRFFYFGDSLFFRYTQQAFAALVPGLERRDAGWFLALFREIGGWRTDVCDVPQRQTKGGCDNVSDHLPAFERRWARLPRDPEALVIVSPKRLVEALPASVQQDVVAALAPPGQWNAHRQAFLRELPALLERHLGRDALRAATQRVDDDDAALDFEVARACADGADEAELRRLLRGHGREARLLAAFEQGV